ncbi:MAG: hypothetical protein QOI34_1948 [Verrucomicrobiota bacterium]
MAGDISRRSFLRTTALGTAGLALPSQIRAQSARFARKPNLIVFLPDQQRPDTIACYGADPALAPNLSKLASQSFVFQNAYVTHPLCTPSRSSLLTGTWPHVNGCRHNNVPLDPSFRCLPELIDDRDYHYCYMGKWHLGDEVLAQHGFTEWVSIHGSTVSRAPWEHTGSVASDYDKFLLAGGFAPDQTDEGLFSRHFASTLPIEFSKPKFLENKVCDFLDQRGQEPFVLFVGFYEPHPPYNGPLNEEHPLERIRLDPTYDHNFGDDMPLRYRLRQEWDQTRYGSKLEKHLKIKQRYLGLVTEVDRSIGAILSKLDRLGLTDNTIIVHTSDHGDMMSAHRMFGKAVLFQEAIRVPFLIRLPNQRGSVSIQQNMSQIDFVPTILELLGKNPDPQCAGTSRAALLRGEAVSPETIFLEWSPGEKRKTKKHTHLAGSAAIHKASQESTRVAISPSGWKLCLRDFDKSELYHLSSDPGERKNLYGQRHLEHVTRRLTDKIHAWQETTRDTIKV